jgi:hypothetical protein
VIIHATNKFIVFFLFLSQLYIHDLYVHTVFHTATLLKLQVFITTFNSLKNRLYVKRKTTRSFISGEITLVPL